MIVLLLPQPQCFDQLIGALHLLGQEVQRRPSGAAMSLNEVTTAAYSRATADVSSAGALTGLMFVVIALTREQLRRAPPHALRSFATPTIVHFTTVLSLAALLSNPRLHNNKCRCPIT